MAGEVQLEEVAPRPMDPPDRGGGDDEEAGAVVVEDLGGEGTSGKGKGKAGESTGAEDKDKEPNREGEDRVGAVQSAILSATTRGMQSLLHLYIFYSKLKMHFNDTLVLELEAPDEISVKKTE